VDDLFGSADGFEILPMIDAEVRFWRGFYSSARSAELMQQLTNETSWRQETIILWGKQHLQPRLSAWYADTDTKYAYSGLMLAEREWTATLQQIREDVEAATGLRYNSVLLNLYRDGQDSMGWHSDDETELGINPAVASLSLGATRLFRFRHRFRHHGAAAQKSVAVELTDGSLLLMAGPTQHYWQHGIAKVRAETGARLNLTFRKITKRAKSPQQENQDEMGRQSRE